MIANRFECFKALQDAFTNCHRRPPSSTDAVVDVDDGAWSLRGAPAALVNDWSDASRLMQDPTFRFPLGGK